MRSELAGGIFHVTMRGNARATIFHEPHDYEVFIRMLAKAAERFAWLLHAFVLLRGCANGRRTGPGAASVQPSGSRPIPRSPGPAELKAFVAVKAMSSKHVAGHG